MRTADPEPSDGNDTEEVDLDNPVLGGGEYMDRGFVLPDADSDGGVETRG